ncbi:hypothetical protein [Candidatus Regiella insecticola]|uniref:hypothetical protein n=1 Tax=Candidatus Regiella insecticola TaxID=138073 RepID=UPI0012FF364A|nr:hypothetical protein [Candidatus Regiella insecticola]
MIQGVGAKTVQIVRQATTTQDQIKLLQPYMRIARTGQRRIRVTEQVWKEV